ncbi:amidohydrolase family protein [Actinomadura alba]|uniref:amidohydrolase family protein n=1 Tax=Actinomadura alba TaxID=406431 RepID=UPI0031D7FEE1
METDGAPRGLPPGPTAGLTPGLPSDVAEALAGPLVDHHCHGVRRDGLDRPGFERLIVEGGLPAPPGTTHFDSPVGLAIRRWCAPVLGLPPHAAPADYLARRADLGSHEVNRRLLREAGIGDFCVDTGLNDPGLLSPAEMGLAGGGRGHEVVRVERVAEEVAERGPSAAKFADEFAEELFRRAGAAVALKSIIAYRHGLDFDPWPPEPGEVVAAVSRWFAGYHAHERLTDPVLLRHGLWTAVGVAREYGLPIQFHTGFGDPDLALHRANPLLMTDFVRAVRPAPIVLLHCHPYVREAAALAAVYPHVNIDVGLAVTYTAAGSATVIAEALELTPFHKILFSSDCYALPELCRLGALFHRRGLGAVLARRIADGEWSPRDAARIARLIGEGNARRLYRLTRTEKREQ